MSASAKHYAIGFRLWINKEEGHFMGAGRVRLLEHIKKTGSITKGAEAMKMSYRQAWQMVEDMNKGAGKPLVEKILGGRGGGGAIVTETGENAIRQYYRIEKKIAKVSKELSETISF